MNNLVQQQLLPDVRAEWSDCSVYGGWRHRWPLWAMWTSREVCGLCTLPISASGPGSRTRLFGQTQPEIMVTQRDMWSLIACGEKVHLCLLVKTEISMLLEVFSRRASDPAKGFTGAEQAPSIP